MNIEHFELKTGDRVVTGRTLPCTCASGVLHEETPTNGGATVEVRLRYCCASPGIIVVPIGGVTCPIVYEECDPTNDGEVRDVQIIGQQLNGGWSPFKYPTSGALDDAVRAGEKCNTTLLYYVGVGTLSITYVLAYVDDGTPWLAGKDIASVPNVLRVDYIGDVPGQPE